MTTADYVRAMRAEHSMTQVELSEKAGVGLRFVRELERGKLSLKMDKVNLVLELFGTILEPVSMDRAQL
jgi:y4mF family transcriptional regulator